MSKLKVSKSQLFGSLTPPSSKSQGMRALIFALLAKGTSSIRSLLPSPDTDAMIQAICALGAEVFWKNGILYVQGTGGEIQPPRTVIDAGNSGIVYRFIAALCALQNRGIAIITGDASIRERRPISPLLNALNSLGVQAKSCHPSGGAPIWIKGGINPGRVRLNGQDSQPVSALLIACAFAKGPFDILVHSLGERPWLDLTLFWLRSFGISVNEPEEGHFQLAGGAEISGFDYEVPSDISSASYALAAALITGSELRVEKLPLNTPQGDLELIDRLIDLGAHIEKEGHSVHIRKGGRLKGGQLSVTPFVDALPLLAVLGCFCEKPLILTETAICRQKESDRVSAICEELKKMGAQLEESYDRLVIHPSKLRGADLEAHSDHRIALSLAVGALTCEEPSEILGFGCTEKSYPSFVSEFKRIGAQFV